MLSERLWEGRCKRPDLDAWLNNFDGRYSGGDSEKERLHALYLLAHVSYFGLPEIRVLLRAMYRDLFRYPIIQTIRRELGGVKDEKLIGQRFAAELQTTRFVGMGNPAESGTHLLYFFRQENRLSRSLFAHQHELLNSAATDPEADFSPPDLKRIVFIDDFCGSGEQSVRYSDKLLRVLDDVAERRGRKVEYFYFVLFGTNAGLHHARSKSKFNVVEAVGELDSTDQTFGASARIFKKPPVGVSAEASRHLALHYGRELSPRWPLGYEDGQLLLAFSHNIPDNSLPILWFDEGQPAWTAIFPRHPKIG
jgi:hypothetical protein